MLTFNYYLTGFCLLLKSCPFTSGSAEFSVTLFSSQRGLEKRERAPVIELGIGSLPLNMGLI